MAAAAQLGELTSASARHDAAGGGEGDAGFGFISTCQARTIRHETFQGDEEERCLAAQSIAKSAAIVS